MITEPLFETIEVYTCPLCRNKFGDKEKASECIRKCTLEIEEQRRLAECTHERAILYFDITTCEDIVFVKSCLDCKKEQRIIINEMAQSQYAKLWEVLAS